MSISELVGTLPGSTSPAAAYEDRLVLFVDFLAFKEHVDRTESEPAHLGRIIDALRELQEIGMEPEVFPSQQLTHFSDSVVVSFRINETSAVFWLLNEIGLAIISLADRGFLLRGAVTVGKLLHTSKVLLGPALVRAYQLESKVARYPRVIIDPAVIALARQHHSAQHEPDEEDAYVQAMLKHDEDGHAWIDYVSWDAVTRAGCDVDSYALYLDKLGGQIAVGLAATDSRVAAKYLWLHRHYEAAIQNARAVPACSDPELEACRTFVATLPLYEDRVAAARLLVGSV